MRLLGKAHRNPRAMRDVTRGPLRTGHPLLVHVIPMRRCFNVRRRPQTAKPDVARQVS